MCQETLEETYVNAILPDKLRLDLAYIDHCSFLVDLDILLRTLLVLLPRFAEAAPDVEELLFGPVQRFIRRYLSWFVLDLILSAVAIFAAGVVWWCAIHPFRPGWIIGIGSAVGMVLTYTLVNQLWGLQRHSWSCAGGHEVVDIFVSAVCSTAVLQVFNLLGFGLPWELILLGGFFAFAAFTGARYRSRLVTGMLWRWRHRWGRERTGAQKRMLVVGAGELGQFCARQVQCRLEGEPYRVVGFVDDDLRKRCIRVQGIKVLGTLRELSSLIAEHNVDLVIVADPDLDQDRWQAVLEKCQKLPARFRVVPDLLAFISSPE
jgi:FlaA1/EpsC-like NDP-sugar epimerase